MHMNIPAGSWEIWNQVLGLLYPLVQAPYLLWVSVCTVYFKNTGAKKQNKKKTKVLLLPVNLIVMLHISVIYIYDISLVMVLHEQWNLKYVTYWHKAGVGICARLSWKQKLACDRKDQIEDSLLFLFSSVSCWFCTPRSRHRQTNDVNKTVAEVFHAGTLFLVGIFWVPTKWSGHITNEQ